MSSIIISSMIVMAIKTRALAALAPNLACYHREYQVPFAATSERTEPAKLRIDATTNIIVFS